MSIRIVNIKDDNPPVDVALFRLKEEIMLSKLRSDKILKVIHGYGASGKGGSIKRHVRFALKAYKKSGFIKDFIPGEHWSPYKVKEMGLSSEYMQLILNSDGENLNTGVSMIILH